MSNTICIFEQVPKVLSENSIRRLMCKGRERRYFQTDNWE